MSKRNKIICSVLVIIFIIAIVVTGVIGLNVGTEYTGGTTITFDLKKQYKSNEISDIAKEIWNKEQILIQKVEVYKESVAIKVSSVNDEQLENLANKINEKYEAELKKEDLHVTYNANVRLRDIITPYIIPLIIATGLIVVYYSIRFRGVREILELLLKLVLTEGIIYSVYALTRLPVNSFTIPIGMLAYIGIVLWVTIKSEKNKN